MSNDERKAWSSKETTVILVALFIIFIPMIFLEAGHIDMCSTEYPYSHYQAWTTTERNFIQSEMEEPAQKTYIIKYIEGAQLKNFIVSSTVMMII